MTGRVVPRVARSLDEVKVGMVVAYHRDDEWGISRVRTVESRYWQNVEWDGGVVILSEPARPAYRVPAEQVDALREQMREIDRVSSPTHPFWEKNWEDTVDKTLQAARSLLDAAEVEGDGE